MLERDVRERDAEPAGEESHQLLVGCAVDRWGGDPDLQGIVLDACDPGPACAGLDPHGQDQAGPGRAENTQRSTRFSSRYQVRPPM